MGNDGGLASPTQNSGTPGDAPLSTSSGLRRCSRVPYRFSPTMIFSPWNKSVCSASRSGIFVFQHDVANKEDFKTTWVGETSVIVTRDERGEIHAMENRCAHKVQSSASRSAVTPNALVCTTAGTTTSMARCAGLLSAKAAAAPAAWGKTSIRPIIVSSRCELPVIAALCAPSTKTHRHSQDTTGNPALDHVEEALGRPYRLIGYHSQILHNNWKLYAENVRDPYHATLLHTFYTTFKINRMDMEDGLVLSECGRHSYSYAKRRLARQTLNTNAPECIRRSTIRGLQGLRLWKASAAC